MVSVNLPSRCAGSNPTDWIISRGRLVTFTSAQRVTAPRIPTHAVPRQRPNIPQAAGYLCAKPRRTQGRFRTPTSKDCCLVGTPNFRVFTVAVVVRSDASS